MATFLEFLADNWLALTGAVTGVIGLSVAVGSMRISKSVRALAHVADLESRVHSGPKHDELGRPILTLHIENPGPGVALDVKVHVTETFVGDPDPDYPGWWHKPSTIEVVDRLRPENHAEVDIPASGDDLELIEIRWKDGRGRRKAHPEPPNEIFVAWL